MNAHDVLKNYREQAFATTMIFFVVIIFGFVFWKMFAAENSRILHVEERYSEIREMPVRPAITFRP